MAVMASRRHRCAEPSALAVRCAWFTISRITASAGSWLSASNDCAASDSPPGLCGESGGGTVACRAAFVRGAHLPSCLRSRPSTSARPGGSPPPRPRSIPYLGPQTWPNGTRPVVHVLLQV